MRVEQPRSRGQAARWDLVFGFGMLAILCLYLYKLPLGSVAADEAFYITIPQRLLQGDVFFADEWHGSQLYCFYTAPILALRNLFFPTGEGIILHWRYCYLIVHSLLCLIMYLRLRKKYRWSAAAGVLVLYLFTPYDICALCYNTLGLDLIALTASLAVTAESKKAWFTAGLAFAAGVLCTPHLVFLYALGSLIALGFGIWKRRKDVAERWLAFTGGCALLAVLLLCFILSRTSLSQVIAALPNLFSDPEHPPISFGIKLRQAVTTARPWALPLAEDAVFLLIAVLDKKRREHPLPYVGGVCAMSLVMYLRCLSGLPGDLYNHLMAPLVPLGVLAFVLSEKKDNRCLWFFWLGGLGYAFCVHLGSNQVGYILTSMCAVPLLGTLLLSGGLIGEQKRGWLGKRGVAACVAAVLCVQVGLMTYVKLNHKFWDSTPNRELTATIEKGPWAGIKVAPNVAREYEQQLNVFQSALSGRAPGRLLCVGGKPWYYLVDPEMTIGAYSAWLSGTGAVTVDRLCRYYEMDPSHVPDYIFFPPEASWDTDAFQTRILDAYGFVPAEAEGGTLYLRQSSSD